EREMVKQGREKKRERERERGRKRLHRPIGYAALVRRLRSTYHQLPQAMHLFYSTTICSVSVCVCVCVCVAWEMKYESVRVCEITTDITGFTKHMDLKGK